MNFRRIMPFAPLACAMLMSGCVSVGMQNQWLARPRRGRPRYKMVAGQYDGGFRA